MYPGQHVYQRSDYRIYSSKPVIVGEYTRRKRPEMSLAISELFSEDDLGRVDTVRTGHLTSLALVAESYPFAYGCLVV